MFINKHSRGSSWSMFPVKSRWELDLRLRLSLGVLGYGLRWRHAHLPGLEGLQAAPHGSLEDLLHLVFILVDVQVVAAVAVPVLWARKRQKWGRIWCLGLLSRSSSLLDGLPASGLCRDAGPAGGESRCPLLLWGPSCSARASPDWPTAPGLFWNRIVTGLIYAALHEEKGISVKIWAV